LHVWVKVPRDLVYQPIGGKWSNLTAKLLTGLRKCEVRRMRTLPGNNPSPSADGAPGLGGGATTPTAANLPQEQVTPEQQIVNMESQRAKWLDEGNPAAAIIPPTPLTQQVTGGGEGAPGGGPPVPGD
jgi:hypothetical protein